MRSLHRPLMVTAALMLVLLLVSAAGLLLDDRVLVGAPIWLKPFKFSVSIVAYSVTLAWMISLLTRGRRVANVLGTVISVAFAGEMVVIVGQVIRGRMSHFNAATPLDAALFGIMGLTITLVWAATLWIGVLLLIQRIGARPVAMAIRLGVVIALTGLATGFLMTNPTSDQLAALENGAQLTNVGAHSVGVPDGGASLPLVGWSTEGGDLRVGHFVGMHALQALPLLALALGYLSRRWRRLADETLRLRLVVLAGIVHGGLTLLVTWQALRGQPLIRPDGLTLAAAGAIALAALAGAVWSFTRPAAPSPSPGAADAPAPSPSAAAATPSPGAARDGQTARENEAARDGEMARDGERAPA